MTDSHCHLTRLPDLDAAVAASGLAWLVTVGTSLDDSRAALAVARRAPGAAGAGVLRHRSQSLREPGPVRSVDPVSGARQSGC